MTALPFTTRPSQVHAHYCLDVKHTEAGCARCSAFCPASAITLNDAGMAVDAARCLGCGLCLHACPAEVFETNRWNERTPLDNLDELRMDTVEFFCTRHPHPETGQRASGSTQIPICLAAMSPGIWFELGLKRMVRVRLDACAGCELASTLSAIEASVATANDWLRDAGHDANVTCVTQVNASEALAQRPVLSSEHRRLSRRGFFRSLFCAAEQKPGTPVETPEPPWAGQDSPKLQPRLPSWMAYAAQAYAQNSRTIAEPTADWPTIHINADCVHCNACTDHCPSGALEARFSAERYVVTFTPGQCVDCRICWASCPVGAITRLQAPAYKPFERRAVLQCQVDTCVHCGRPAETGKSICYWCAEEPPLASLLTDARRWLFSAQPANLMDTV